MKNKIYKYIIILQFSLVLLSVSTLAANKTISLKLTYDNQVHNYNEEEIFVAIDGEQLSNLSMPPIILNGYTLVPAREVFEKMGAVVEWKSDIEQAVIKSGDNVIIIPINSKTAYVNGKASEMDTEAKIINNKTMIPLRFVSAAMGYEVNWDNETRTVNISLPLPKVVKEAIKIKEDDYCYKLVNGEDEILAEYPYIKYIGCNVYAFCNDENYIGILNSKGEIIIEPEFLNDWIFTSSLYAVNNTLTLKKDNTFYIYDTKGELKKTIEAPLGYELAYPGYNEKYLKQYDIKAISGSNVVVAEHWGNTTIETSSNQEYFIIRLFSEKKAAEDYYNIIALPNGEFIAIDRKTDLGVFLNADGSLKEKMNMYLNPSSQILHGDKYFVTYYDKNFFEPNTRCDIVEYNGNVVCENIKNEEVEVELEKLISTETDVKYSAISYKLINNNNELLADYPYIHYIGCDMYLFKNANDCYGALDKSGNVIIEPKYSYVEGTKYAVNNIVTFQSGNRFDIYDNKGNLKKSIDSPLGYKLEYPGFNEKYLKRYDVEAISGSNVVVAEHLGDMTMEPSNDQEYFIIKLFSEQKAAEGYNTITPLPNGEFTAFRASDNAKVVLNADGSLKFEP